MLGQYSRTFAYQRDLYISCKDDKPFGHNERYAEVSSFLASTVGSTLLHNMSLPVDHK